MQTKAGCAVEVCIGCEMADPRYCILIEKLVRILTRNGVDCDEDIYAHIYYIIFIHGINVEQKGCSETGDGVAFIGNFRQSHVGVAVLPFSSLTECTHRVLMKLN